MLSDVGNLTSLAVTAVMVVIGRVAPVEGVDHIIG
jgi:hypothetical protein